MNNNIKFAVVVEIVKNMNVNGESFRAESAEAMVFETAQEALAAFEAAETPAALVAISADVTKEVRKDLGAVRTEGVTIWEGHSQWYPANPKTWVARKGNLGYWSFRKGFVALMRAAW